MNYKGWGLRTFSWRLSGRIVAVSGREERERAVELYFSTPMSTKQVVEHLGYPTRQCPGTVAARRSQVCGCRPQAAHTVGDAVSRGGIVPVWYAAEAGGDGAWRQRRCGASLDETVPRRVVPDVLRKSGLARRRVRSQCVDCMVSPSRDMSR